MQDNRRSRAWIASRWNHSECVTFSNPSTRLRRPFMSCISTWMDETSLRTDDIQLMFQSVQFVPAGFGVLPEKDECR